MLRKLASATLCMAVLLIANHVVGQEKTETLYCPVYPYAYHYNGNTLVYVSYYAVDSVNCTEAVSIDGPDNLTTNCPGGDCHPSILFREKLTDGKWKVPTGTSGHNPDGRPLTIVDVKACWFKHKHKDGKEKKIYAYGFKHVVDPPGELPSKEFFQGWEIKNSNTKKEGTIVEVVEEEKTYKIDIDGDIYQIQLTESRK